MYKKVSDKILSIDIPNESKKTILEKMLKGQREKTQFTHVISINPEILVIIQKNQLFKDIVNKAQIKVIDGIGVVLAAKILNIKHGERYSGVDIVEDISKRVSVGRLRVVFIGGKDNLAEKLADCYNKKYAQNSFFGIKGIENIKKVKKIEEDRIFSIITELKPHFLFVAFGSPYQEIWLWKNKSKLKGIICMGVGGALDYLTGNIRRPNTIIRNLGLEWLYRLIIQPWRWKRQLRLIKFMYLVFKQKIFMRN